LEFFFGIILPSAL